MTDNSDTENADTARPTTAPNATHAVQPDTPFARDRTVLVDALAAPDDYWLSITDAARVTRRQEITIRRWIAAGELPVRGQRMGLNKRTRHVRASDLARLTPIIDPAAAITGAPAQVNLLSIPEQQAQLLLEQQRVAREIEALAHRAGDVDARGAALGEELQHVRSDAATAVQALHHVQAITQSITTRTDALADALAASQHDHARHSQRIESIAHALETVETEHTTLAQRATAAEQTVAHLSSRLDDLAALAARHELQLQACQESLTELSSHLATLETRVAHLLQQAGEHDRQHTTALQAIEQLRADVATVVQRTTDLRASYAHHIEAQAATEQHVHTVDERITALQQVQDQLRREIIRARRLPRGRIREAGPDKRRQPPAASPLAQQQTD